tara:strand:+ start:64389 stop:66008 length:1620 start_codon:yes stop_codon:yes gene_type:complete
MKNFVSSAGYLGCILILISGYLYVSDTATQRTVLIVLLVGLGLVFSWLFFEWDLVGNLIGRRTTRYGANTLAMVLLLLGILSFVNLIGSRYTQRIDTTANKRFSLADLTVSVLSELKQDVHIIGFLRSGGSEATIRYELNDMLNQYKYHSSHITYEFVDPDKEPNIARQYNISAYGTVVFESEGKTEHINRYLEESVTNALVKVTREGQKKIYFLEGHGEHNINLTDGPGYNKIQQMLENQSYVVKSLSLLSEIEVPSDCNVLVIAGPTTNLVGNEQEAIRDYLNRGGRALFLINPNYPDQNADLSSLLIDWNVRLGENVVIDPSAVGRLPGMNEYMPAVMQYPAHPITRSLQNTVSYFPLVRSVDPVSAPDDTVEIQTIAMTSNRSWAETELPGTPEEAADYIPELDPDSDEVGPVSIAVAITAIPRALPRKDMTTLTPQEIAMRPEEHELKTRIVVFGNSSFASNAYVLLPGNGDLALNTFNWLAEEEDLLAIRPKSSDTRLVQISLSQMQDIFIITCILSPIGILIAGIMVWWRRK